MTLRERRRRARAARARAQRRQEREWARVLRYSAGPFAGPGEAMVY